MTIAFRAAGLVGVGTTSVTPGDPAGWTTGDAVITVRAMKPSTATLATPAGHIMLGQNTGGGNTQGIDTGPSRVGVSFREKTSAWSAMPAYTQASTPNATAAMAFAFSKDPGKLWDFDNRNGTFLSTPGTALNVTTSAIYLKPGDWVCSAISNQSDDPTWGSQSYTASGITFSAITEFSEAVETTTGQDVGGAFWGAQVTAGEGTVTVQQQATASAQSTGAIVFIRMREVWGGWGPVPI